MDSREKIFEAISSILDGTTDSSHSSMPEKSPSPSVIDFSSLEDLCQIFSRAVEQNGGVVHAFSSSRDLIHWLKNIFGDSQNRKIVIAQDDKMKRAGLRPDIFQSMSQCTTMCISETPPEEDDRVRLRHFISQADIGITSAFLGLADSGSIAVCSQLGETRSGSLLPPTHICILHSEDIFPDMDAAVERIHEQIMRRGSSAVTFIGGPSRTADIEKVLVTGVHGPKNFIVCVIA